MRQKDERQVNESTSGASLSSFEQLPDDILERSIEPYFSENDLCSLSGLSTTLFSTYRAPLAKTLLLHVLRGEEKEALEMIHNNPRLLIVTSEGTDYSGRTYKGITAFQAALLCHDVTLWKKIEPYFDTFFDGRAEKIRQFNWLFPEGFPEQRPYDFTSLIQAISDSSDADIQTALRKENNETKICQVLKDFRQTFTDLAMNETFFNPLHLMKAYEVYNGQFYIWSWNQRDLFWRQVIGYTQRFLPASYAQAFVQGLYYILEEKKPLQRSLKFHFQDHSYFPIVDSSWLGFDFGCECAVWWRSGWLCRRMSRGARYEFDKLCRANTAELLGLEHRMRDDGQSITGSDSLTPQSRCTIL